MGMVIIAHPDKQHSYQTAVALKANGVGILYVTTIYNKRKSITRLLIRLIPNSLKSKLQKYHCEKIDDKEVIQFCEARFLLYLLIMRVPYLSHIKELLRIQILNSYNKKLTRLVKDRMPSALITYDTLSGDVIEEIKNANAKTELIVDMSAPYFPEMRLEFIKAVTTESCDAKERMISEMNTRISQSRMKNAEKELLFADRFLVASMYTQSTLLKNGIDKNKIKLCRYGAEIVNNVNRQELASTDLSKTHKLSIVYVGNISYRKGAHYLIKSLVECSDVVNECVFIGSALQAPDLEMKYRDKYTFTGRVSHDEVLQMCQKADIGIFPSLSDGYGFAVAEYLGCGLPVICSENAGAADLIIDGFNGFVIQAGNPEMISKYIIWFYNHPDLLSIMKKNAKDTALKRPWELYYNDVHEAVKDIL